MTKILVTGGSGALGRNVVQRLANSGYEVRAMSRQARSAQDVEWVQADIETGRGLPEALNGIDTIVHLASDPFRHQRIDVAGSQRLLQQARSQHISHFIYISIVGIDHINYAYYQSKLAVERMIEQAGIPWSILRATQFHTFLDTVLHMLAKSPLLFLPSDLQFQLLDPDEAAERLCELVASGPAGRVPDLGGPEVLKSNHLARLWLQQQRKARLVVPFYWPGKFAASIRRGDNTCPTAPRRGKITWESWLTQTYPHQEGKAHVR